ncbi:MAG: hypothetical protein AVDCRST_MAG73-4257, partial [uncultured Thermomicrobiales bacterium]
WPSIVARITNSHREKQPLCRDPQSATGKTMTGTQPERSPPPGSGSGGCRGR